MAPVAFVFPGQGSQHVGMGQDLYQNSPSARAFFEKADAILGFPLTKICFQGPEDELRQTRNTQPAIFVHSIALTAELNDLDPGMVAGHSAQGPVRAEDRRGKQRRARTECVSDSKVQAGRVCRFFRFLLFRPRP